MSVSGLLPRAMIWSVTLMRTEDRAVQIQHCPSLAEALRREIGPWQYSRADPVSRGIEELTMRAEECESRSCPSCLLCGSMGEGKMSSFLRSSTPAAGGDLTHPHTSFSTPENSALDLTWVAQES